MKFWLAFAILAVVVSLSVAGKDEEDTAWEAFKKKHGKHYKSDKEAVERKTHFSRSHKKIDEINSQGLSWQAGHNEFSDWSDEEKEALCGAKVNRTRGTSRITPKNRMSSEDRQLPISLDYRTHVCTRPVKNQGSCGSCWAFAAIAALEFSTCRSYGDYPLSLSEQQLVSCSGPYGNMACRGGWYSAAWQYLQDGDGSVLSSSYPYTSGSTRQNGTCNSWDAYNDVWSWVYDYGYVENNVNTIMQHLVDYGSLAAALEVTSNFGYYKTGVYTDTTCTKWPNHAVTIVGYGTDNTTARTPYWIVRNSWGASWGASGYFLIKRGVNMCFIESDVQYVQSY